MNDDIYFNDLKDKVDNKFELVVLAARRAREMSQPINRNEGLRFKKRTTRSLNEIFDNNKSDIEGIKERLINQYQKEVK